MRSANAILETLDIVSQGGQKHAPKIAGQAGAQLLGVRRQAQRDAALDPPSHTLSRLDQKYPATAVAANHRKVELAGYAQIGVRRRIQSGVALRLPPHSKGSDVTHQRR